MDNYEIKKAELKIQVLSSVAGAKGEEGESMYEIAKKNGFEGTEQEFIAQYMNVNARIGCYECDTDSSTSAKTVQGGKFILPTIPPYGGTIKVKFKYKNSAANPTLSISGCTAKPLYYDGAIASSTNTWADNETVDIYYDGTNFYANNVEGGGKFASGEKVKNVGIDSEPTAGSNNLVKSGGVVTEVNKLKEELHTKPTQQKYIRFLDSNGNVGVQLPIGFDGEKMEVELANKVSQVDLAEEAHARELADEEKPTVVVQDNNMIDFVDEQGNIGARLPVGFDARDLISGGISIFLPDVINAVVGDTLQVFYQSIVQVFDINKYNVVALCDKGKALKRYFEYTPEAADIGTTTLTFEVRDDNGKVLTTKSTSLITNAAPSDPASSKTILVFGDSVTAGGEWVHEVERRLTSSDGTPVGDNLSNIIFAGKLSHEGTKYFGYGGWWWKQYIKGADAAFRFYVENVTSLKMYGKYTNNGYQYEIREINVTGTSGNILCITSATTNVPETSGTLTKVSGGGDSTITFTSVEAASQSPLYDAVNDIFTFAPYVTEYCNGKCDAVYVLLSANHQTPWRKVFTEEMTYVKQWADTLHSEYPNAKLRIVGLQSPSVTGGCGFSYGAGGGYSDEYGIKVTFQRQCELYQEFANSEGYSTWVQYVDVASQFDALYNMPYEMKDVNSRNSDNKEMSGINGVHPNNSGYMQIADAVYRNIVATFCQ